MDQQWAKLLDDLGDTAKTLCAEVPAQLSRDDLTKTEAEKLWVAIGKLCDQSESLNDMMDENGADEALIEAGETVQDILLDLHVAVGEKAIELGSDLKVG